MADYRYLCPEVEDPSDPSALIPLLCAEFPNMGTGVDITTRESNPNIPEGRVLLLVKGINANQHRANLACVEVSEWK